MVPYLESIVIAENSPKINTVVLFWTSQSAWETIYFFQDILTNTEDSHPYIILSEMNSDDVRSIVEFVYRGELNVGADRFSSVLKTAEELQIRGLMEVSTEFQFKFLYSGFYLLNVIIITELIYLCVEYLQFQIKHDSIWNNLSDIFIFIGSDGCSCQPQNVLSSSSPFSQSYH